jgi:hypothetical protein
MPMGNSGCRGSSVRGVIEDGFGMNLKPRYAARKCSSDAATEFKDSRFVSSYFGNATPARARPRISAMTGDLASA